MNFSQDNRSLSKRTPSVTSKFGERARRNNSQSDLKGDLKEFEIYQDLSMTQKGVSGESGGMLYLQSLQRRFQNNQQDEEDTRTTKEYTLIPKIRDAKDADMGIWLKNLYRAILRIQIMLKSPKKLFPQKGEGHVFQEELSKALETILSHSPCTLKDKDLEVFVSLMEIIREMNVLEVAAYQTLGIAYLSCCFRQNIRYEQDFLDSLLALLDKKELMKMLQEQFLKKTPMQSLAKKKISEIFDYSDMVLCLICQENLRKYLFNPCKHFVTCENCSSKCTTCPICRSKISERVSIYWT